MNVNPKITPEPLAKTTSHVRATGKSRLALWLSKLPNHTLPLNPSLTQAIKVEINDLESTSERIGGLVQQDPPLVLNLYQFIHSKIEAKEGDIQGLVHLIGLIGLRHIEKTLTPRPPSASLKIGQCELYSASSFSAYLAKYLMPKKHGTTGERFFLPTLFFNAPLWLMWQAAPVVMENIQTSASEKQMAHDLLYRSKLGFRLPNLFKRAKDIAQLPEQTLKALSIDIYNDLPLWANILRLRPKKTNAWFEENKAAKHFFYSTEMGIYLINQYVLALYFDWNGKHIRRFENLLCKHLCIGADELHDIVGKSALALKMPKVFGEACKPAFRVRGLHRGEDNGITDKPVQKVASIHTNPLVLLGNATTANDALHLAHKALVKMTRPQHCITFCKGKNTNKSLQVLNDFGFSDSAIEALTLEATMCGGFFKKIMQKPIALYISPEKIPSIKPQMPRPLLRFWEPESFSILSVFFDDEPLAIIICDNKTWGQTQHQQFISIGKQLTKTLKNCPSLY